VARRYLAAIIEQITETWHKRGTAATVTFWCRPLTAMIAAFRSANFVIEDIQDPCPRRSARSGFLRPT